MPIQARVVHSFPVQDVVANLIELVIDIMENKCLNFSDCVVKA